MTKYVSIEQVKYKIVESFILTLSLLLIFIGTAGLFTLWYLYYR